MSVKKEEEDSRVYYRQFFREVIATLPLNELYRLFEENSVRISEPSRDEPPPLKLRIGPLNLLSLMVEYQFGELVGSESSKFYHIFRILRHAIATIPDILTSTEGVSLLKNFTTLIESELLLLSFYVCFNQTVYNSSSSHPVAKSYLDINGQKCYILNRVSGFLFDLYDLGGNWLWSNKVEKEWSNQLKLREASKVLGGKDIAVEEEYQILRERRKVLYDLQPELASAIQELQNFQKELQTHYPSPKINDTVLFEDNTAERTKWVESYMKAHPKVDWTKIPDSVLDSFLIEPIEFYDTYSETVNRPPRGTYHLASIIQQKTPNNKSPKHATTLMSDSNIGLSVHHNLLYLAGCRHSQLNTNSSKSDPLNIAYQTPYQFGGSFYPGPKMLMELDLPIKHPQVFPTVPNFKEDESTVDTTHQDTINIRVWDKYNWGKIVPSQTHRMYITNSHYSKLSIPVGPVLDFLWVISGHLFSEASQFTKIMKNWDDPIMKVFLPFTKLFVQSFVRTDVTPTVSVFTISNIIPTPVSVTGVRVSSKIVEHFQKYERDGQLWKDKKNTRQECLRFARDLIDSIFLIFTCIETMFSKNMTPILGVDMTAKSHYPEMERVRDLLISPVREPRFLYESTRRSFFDIYLIKEWGYDISQPLQTVKQESQPPLKKQKVEKVDININSYLLCNETIGIFYQKSDDSTCGNIYDMSKIGDYIKSVSSTSIGSSTTGSISCICPMCTFK